MSPVSSDFRELLEEVLPLDRLLLVERQGTRRNPGHEVALELEHAAQLALQRLAAGRVQAVTPAPGREPSTTSPAPIGPDAVPGLETGLLEEDGLQVIPRAALPSKLPASLDQVRRLLRADEAALLSDPRTGETRSALLRQLEAVGHELLGPADIRFFPRDPGPAGTPVSPLLSEAARRPEAVWYSADTSLSETLAARAQPLGVGAVAAVAVVTSTGDPIGHLEVRHRGRNVFRPEQLTLVALLGDYCAGVLERAARIERLVFVDPLTEVPNRSYFELEARSEMARAQREGESMALCIVDIDDFKSFNTAYGYEAGNEVLAQVASALRRGVRPFDTVARWGGEEFAVLLTTPVHEEDARAISERLRAAVQRLRVGLEGLDRRSHEVGVTVSMGVALFPDHASEMTELWRVANRALLEAKQPPKNQVVFYRPDLTP